MTTTMAMMTTISRTVNLSRLRIIIGGVGGVGGSGFLASWRRPSATTTSATTEETASSLDGTRRSFSSSSSSLSQKEGIQLHYDWIGPKPTSDPCYDHIVVFLHGLLGNGRNLRTMAKKLCDSSQQRGILIDIRGHGKSTVMSTTTSSSSDFDACVQDLRHTLESIPEVSTTDTSVTLVGHSLGGRIALQYAYNAVMAATTSTNDSNNKYNPLNRIWLLDTVPGQANDSVERVIRAITELSAEAAKEEEEENNGTTTITINDRRKTLMKQLTSDPYKIDKGTAQWLASSLKQPTSNNNNGGSSLLEFGFDLNVVHGLLSNFHQQDFMQLLETIIDEGDIRTDLVRGGKNKGWTESKTTLGPLEELERNYNSSFGIHVLPNAGHWVHVDDLPGLLDVMDVTPR